MKILVLSSRRSLVSISRASFVILTATIFVALSENVGAELVLTIDRSAELLSVTGSDTGEPSFVGGTESVVRWDAIYPGSASTPEVDGVVKGFDGGSGWSVVNELRVFEDFDPTFAKDERGLLFLLIAPGSVGSQTVVGAISGYDYSGFTAGQKSALQSAIDAGSVPLTQGTGFSAITVMVPEPDGLKLLALTIILGAPVFIRHRQRVSSLG